MAEAAEVSMAPVSVEGEVAPPRPGMGMAGVARTASNVKKLSSKLKSKAAARRAQNSFRQMFVQYAESFGKKDMEDAVIRAAFDKIDADNSGYIDSDELRAMTRELGIEMDEQTLQGALRIMDENGDNEIEFDEFRDWWILQGNTGAGAEKSFVSESEDQQRGGGVGPEASFASDVDSVASGNRLGIGPEASLASLASSRASSHASR